MYRQSKATATFNLRTHAEVLGLFDGFEMVDPGLVQLPLWRPDGPVPSMRELSHIGGYGGVGVKN